MVCTNCLLPGHNSRSKTCLTNVILNNFDIIYEYTHSYPYYVLSLKNIVSMCNSCCLYKKQITWKNDVLNGEGGLYSYIVNDSCKNKYIIVNLSIKEVHANYLIINNTDKTITHYEPHGWLNYDSLLSEKLKFFSSLLGYVFIPSIVDCPGIGPQPISQENYGLCQSFNLYNLYNRLSKNNKKLSKSALLKDVKLFSSKMITHIYYNYIPESMKMDFLTYNIQEKKRKNEIIAYTISKI